MITQKEKYQLVLILEPKLESRDQEALFEKIGEKLGKIEKKDHLGIKDMRYKIKGWEKGDYWVLEIGEKMCLTMKEINLFLNRETKIIRYLLLKRR
ncbi:MAG TPA: 30S ribosomal protein S6 [Candidatus Woesebacteria bacterium]|nr:30S ribosomal protein S6 [Candidatus Woesebacteria bacterium]HRS22853.1 30S ribosomal protein S6 [Candidatus Woesebacteria bacterium]HRT40160.1 30S ribosomal protein S6 [Candidatus Woesebacteria bacterium]